MKKARTRAEWTSLAERKLRKILTLAQSSPSLARRVPGGAKWGASIEFIGAPQMTRLNGEYRGKSYPTDVLSFNAPEVFVHAGQLGELVICLPVLRRQAREREHAPEIELEILLVHGVLHLLGMDHELGPKKAAEMARWEARLLRGRVRGLIAQARSGG